MADLPDAVRALVPALVEGTRVIRLVNYMATSGYALMVVDFLQTFPDEVRIMWPAPMSFPKVLFFTLRYYLFVHAYLSASFAYPTNISPEVCANRFLRTTLSDQAVVIVSEVVLFVRVYAFSGRDKRMLAWLIFQFIGIHAVTKVYLLVKYIRTVKFIQFPFTGLFCMPAAMNNKLLNIVFGLLLASIAIDMIIMVYLAFLKHKNFNNNLLRVFYQDGIFYFVLLSGFAIASIVINTSAPEGGLKYLFINMQVNIHAILASRMILHLRLQAERDRQQYALGTLAVGDMDYATAANSTHGLDSGRLSKMQFKNQTVDSTVLEERKGHDSHWS